MRLLLTLLLPMLGACVAYEGNADVIVEWDFDGQTCGQASVSLVSVELVGVISGEIHIAEHIPCEEVAFVFEDMTIEDYFVRVDGEQSLGFVTWAAEGRLDGISAGDNLFTVSLLPVGP